MKRTLAPLGLVIALAAFLYAYVQMSRVANLVNPFAQAADEQEPVPLEKAAPEVVRHRDAFRALAAKARAAAPACKDRDNNAFPVVSGKALIWDAAGDDVSLAHGLLPAEVRAPDAPGAVAVFLITRQERRPWVAYRYDPFSGGGTTGVRGFRTDTWLCAIAMPGARPLGRYKIYGDDPPSAIRVKPGQTEVDGGWTGPVARWVESCVRGPQWRAKQREPKIPPGREGFARRAAEARTVLDRCKAKGSAGPFPALPARALIWISQPEYPSLLNQLSPAQRLLPADRRAGPDDPELVVVLLLQTAYVGPRPGDRPRRDTARWDQTVAVVTLPGPRPVGQFTLRGEEYLPTVDGRHRDGPDPQQELARWVLTFLRDAAQVKR